MSRPAGGGPVDRIDRAGPVRPGEELDADALGRWLAEALATGPAPPPEIEQFPAGFSNLTYRVRFAGRDLVLRRPPRGAVAATAHDMLREHRILAALAPVYPLAPRPLAACDDPGVLGAPFYVMERVEGLILRAEPPAGLDLGPAVARRLSEAFAGHLAELHAVDVEAAGLAGLGRPGYLERQVTGWSGRWRRAATDPVPEADAVAGWLEGERPAEIALTLVHNDYKYDNLVLDPADPTRVRALLDWEMATVGDPRTDLGTALGYWVEAGDPGPIERLRFGPTHLAGSLGRRQVAERWAEAGGFALDRLAYFYAFGLFKIAVIAQQIYARWRQGTTRDPRFAGLLDAVRALARRAAEVAGGGPV